MLAGDGIVGIDLDGCRDPCTGTIAPWARDIITAIGSYAEVSPSGTGVKILARSDPLPRLTANKMAMGKAAGHAKAPAIEVYLTGRYFALTGQLLDEVPDEVVDATEILAKLAHRIAKPGDKSAELPEVFLTLLERDQRLQKLWHDPGDSDRSRSDLRLAGYLRARLADADITAVLRAYAHGQIGSGKLMGVAAERRIRRILEEVAPRPNKRCDPTDDQEPEQRFRDLTDDGLALDMGARWRGHARYVAAWGKWLFWSGAHWKADDKLLHMTRTRAFLRTKGEELIVWAERMVEKATGDPNELAKAEKARDRMRVLAEDLRSARMINIVVSLTCSNVELAAIVEQWDADALVLGTPRRASS